MVLVGSGVCYGNPGPEHLPVTEDCPLRPNNPYSASKAAADLLGIQHYLAHGTDVVMVRPFNHAGPRQSPTYVLGGAGAAGRRGRGRAQAPRRGRQPRRRPRLHRRPRRRPRLPPAGRHGARRRDLQPRLRPGHQARRRPASTSRRWPAARSRSTSTPPGSARSTSPCSSPTPPSSAPPPAGSRAITIEQTLADMLDQARRSHRRDHDLNPVEAAALSRWESRCRSGVS